MPKRETTRVRIAVVGGGVSGLTCAVRLLEQGAPVTLVTKDAPRVTTSAAAGAVWFPYRVRPNERTGPWGAIGYERFERLARQPGAPVTMVELTALYGEPLHEEPWWLASVPGNATRAATPAELPDGYADGRVVRVACIEAPAYLDWLTQRLDELGGERETRTLDSLAEPPADAVVNCCGVGARGLAGDEDLRPARSEVRLEPDALDDGRPLVHNYGHGGSGFTLSWGCADEVARLVLERVAA
jgi:D-amino-acid oxidase